jgi:hypothetical protein
MFHPSPPPPFVHLSQQKSSSKKSICKDSMKSLNSGVTSFNDCNVVDNVAGSMNKVIRCFKESIEFYGEEPKMRIKVSLWMCNRIVQG